MIFITLLCIVSSYQWYMRWLATFLLSSSCSLMLHKAGSNKAFCHRLQCEHAWTCTHEHLFRTHYFPNSCSFLSFNLSSWNTFHFVKGIYICGNKIDHGVLLCACYKQSVRKCTDYVILLTVCWSMFDVSSVKLQTGLSLFKCCCRIGWLKQVQSSALLNGIFLLLYCYHCTFPSYVLDLFLVFIYWSTYQTSSCCHPCFDYGKFVGNF